MVAGPAPTGKGFVKTSQSGVESPPASLFANSRTVLARQKARLARLVASPVFENALAYLAIDKLGAVARLGRAR